MNFRILLIAALIFTQSLTAVPKKMSLEQLAASSPSSEINLVEILVARRKLKEQKVLHTERLEAEAAKATEKAMGSKMSLMSEAPAEELGMLQERIQQIRDQVAEANDSQSSFLPEISSPIANIEEITIDPKVKRVLKKLIKKQDRQDKLDEIITNQRIMILLLSALTAKLVVYDLYFERMEKAESN